MKRKVERVAKELHDDTGCHAVILVARYSDSLNVKYRYAATNSRMNDNIVLNIMDNNSPLFVAAAEKFKTFLEDKVGNKEELETSFGLFLAMMNEGDF